MEKIFANYIYIYDKELVSRQYKELLNSTLKTRFNLQMGKEFEQTFLQRKYVSGQ